MYLRSILNDFGFKQDTSRILYEDSRSVNVMAENPVNRKASRHIDTRRNHMFCLPDTLRNHMFCLPPVEGKKIVHVIPALVEDKTIVLAPCAARCASYGDERVADAS